MPLLQQFDSSPIKGLQGNLLFHRLINRLEFSGRFAPTLLARIIDHTFLYQRRQRFLDFDSAPCRHSPRHEHEPVIADLFEADLAGSYRLNRGARIVIALQLPFVDFSESMGNHDSKIVDAASVD